MSEEKRSLPVYLNEERTDALLMLAWNHFGRKDAVKCLVTTVDRNSIALDISYPAPKSKESVSYKFRGGPIEESKITVAVGKLLEHNSAANFPPGIVPYCVILLWIAALVGAAGSDDLVKYPILRTLQPLILLIFGQQIYCTYLLLFLIVAHSIEGLHVAYLCGAIINMPKSAIGSWVGLTFILGYPSYSRILYLANILEKNKLR